MDVVLCPEPVTSYFHSYIGFSHYLIKQYQLVNTWKRRCGIQTDISLLAGDLPELKRAQGTEGAEQSSAGTAGAGPAWHPALGHLRLRAQQVPCWER